MSSSISTPTAHTCLNQTDAERDGSVGSLKAHWPWERTSPTKMTNSWLSEAIKQLSAGLARTKVVFIDSQAAILALSSNTPTDYINTIQYRTTTAEFILYGWIAAI
ncbi:hypothetical protein TNCV_351431 [Trichonephila clavipes]|nr:hypothetical protein TNCV_351431 [Trichonephila clavipes]